LTPHIFDHSLELACPFVSSPRCPSSIMKQPTSEILELMLRAAELRASGASWETVGREVNRHADTCRRWAREYADVWRRLYGEAEQLQAREGRAEARVILRKLLRSEEEKMRLAAARDLLKAPRGRGGRKQATPADGEFSTFLSQLQGLSDAELQDMLRRFLAADGGSAAGMAGSPLPPTGE
jgi:hypothetical protein